MTTTDPNVNPFVSDALENEGYHYTTNAPMSSRIANRRLTDATIEYADLGGRRVLDMGCGDGTYTRELGPLVGNGSVVGLDPASAAVGVARKKTTEPNVEYVVSSAYSVPFADDSFDLVHIRGVLHHMDNPVQALREALRVSPKVIAIEPNGYNLGLKLLEKCSKYHIEHKEKSYPATRLDRWIRELGGQVETRTWVGFVAMFSPDWSARLMKQIEPVLERLPLVRAATCASYVFVASRVDGSGRTGSGSGAVNG